MINFVKLFASATKIPMLIPEYYNQWVDRIEDYLNGIDEDFCRSIEIGPYRADLVQAVGNI